ncbi:hypothetical protein AGMMS49992_24700 [Clostridia bacterium]|nr:hypothetical protein AGMMS49992_24700 [Clostridia bacterium]
MIEYDAPCNTDIRDSCLHYLNSKTSIREFAKAIEKQINAPNEESKKRLIPLGATVVCWIILTGENPNTGDWFSKLFIYLFPVFIATTLYDSKGSVQKITKIIINIFVGIELIYSTLGMIGLFEIVNGVILINSGIYKGSWFGTQKIVIWFIACSLAIDFFGWVVCGFIQTPESVANRTSEKYKIRLEKAA